MHLHQRTLHGEIVCPGIGLHTGKKITMTIKPLPPDSGIRFCRTDLPSRPHIQARLENVADTRLATSIAQNGAVVSTIEHLMSAFAGMGIDNALVDLDGPEVPIMDGSAGPFVYLMKNAGVRAQEKLKRFFLITRPFGVELGEKSIRVYPCRELVVTYVIDFKHPLLSKQAYVLRFSGSAFVQEISRARTFGFLKDVESMKNNGFVQGGSLENAIVLDDIRVLNPDGLRFEDEFVRHKILDLMGDLQLLGMPLIGHLVINKSGHALNHNFLNNLRKSKHCWEVVRFLDQRSYEQRQFELPTFAFPRTATA